MSGIVSAGLLYNGMPVSHFPTKKDANNAAAEELSVGTSSVLKKSAAEEFTEFAHMSPAEKMRAMILNNLGVTEDQIKNMSPKERAKIEAKIKEEVKKMIESMNEKKGILIDIPA